MRIFCAVVLVIILLWIILEPVMPFILLLLYKPIALIALTLVVWFIDVRLGILKLLRAVNVHVLRRQFYMLLRKCIRAREDYCPDDLNYVLESVKNKDLCTEKAKRLLGIYLCNVLAYNQL